jgi:hypothetical protein
MQVANHVARQTVNAASLPRTSAFGRFVIARAIASTINRNDPAGVAETFQRVFPGYAAKELAYIQRANEVGAGSTTTWGAELVGDSPSAQFLEAVRYSEVLGRLPGVLDVPPRVSFGAADGLFAAGVVGEGAPIPLYAPSFDRLTISPIKVAGLGVASVDLLRRGNAAQVVGTGLRNAVVKATDGALLSSNSYGLLNGLSPVGTGAADVAAINFQVHALLQSLTGADLTQVAFVCTPEIAVALSLIRLDIGPPAFPTVTVKGGTLAGVPLIVSTGAPADTLVAIDGSALVKSDEGIELDFSRNATIQQSSAPTGSAVTPSAATAVKVSTFQNEAVAIRVVRSVGWELRRGQTR